MTRGYVPVFSSVFDGTLGGKWPDSGIWLCLLALADADGSIDMTPQAISARIGVPVEQLRDCLTRFCAPDPDSRSQEEEGRRLVPLDPARSWGWRVVNMVAYRRKASQRNEVADGKVAERVRRYRERHKDVTASNGALRDVTAGIGTHTETDTHTETEKNSSRKTSKSSIAREMPEDLALSDSMRAFALAKHSDLDLETAFEQFKAHHLARGTKLKRFDMAWRTWVGNMAQFGYPKKNRPGEWI